MYPNVYFRPSLFSALRNIGWSNILDGTQKTLGVINQAIPIVYQVKPAFSNLKSIFRIANAINTPDTTPISNKTNNTSNPVFYI